MEVRVLAEIPLGKLSFVPFLFAYVWSSLFRSQLGIPHVASYLDSPNDKLKHIHEICEISSNQPLNSSGRVKNACERN